MGKINSLFVSVLLFSFIGLGQTAIAQKRVKQVSPEQAKALLLKQQNTELSDLSEFRNKPIPRGMARIILEAHNVWGDGSGYQMLLDADHTAYGAEIPPPSPLGECLTEDCDIPANLYDPFEFKVPENADPSCTPEFFVSDGTASIDIPAGMYDYVVVNPSPGLAIIIPGIFGQVDDTYGDDFIFEEGKIYHFLAYFHEGASFSDTGDCVALTVTNGNTGSFNPVQNLSASVEGTTVTLKWDAPASKDNTVLFEENFESVSPEQTPDGWSVVDADGDGNNWAGLPEYLLDSGHDNSLQAVSSSSWSSALGALTPDNYLITPQLDLSEGGELSFWVRPMGVAEFGDEHYAVYSSLTGNDVADFGEALFEETLSGETTKFATREGAAKGIWAKKTVTVPAGTKYLAFRHFNCTDESRIMLDDILITKGGSSSSYTFTIYRDGEKIKEGLESMTYTEENVAEGQHTYCVEVQYAEGVSSKECIDVTVTQSFDPVNSLFATQDGMDAVLQWTSPMGKAGLERAHTYSVFRNGAEIASNLTETTYRDKDLAPATYTYGVKVIYEGGESITVETVLAITSLSEIAANKPYSLAVYGDKIEVSCMGNVRIYDMNGRSVLVGTDKVEYTAQKGSYVVLISVGDKTYKEKVIVK